MLRNSQVILKQTTQENRHYQMTGQWVIRGLAAGAIRGAASSELCTNE